MATSGMQIFMVGGAVRDALLGLPVQDRDWVIVGGTPEVVTAQGFTPVGKDFPVFLHPDTREEYALARTERKTARGYRGFIIYTSPDITLDEDLARRDLTINAIAVPEHAIAADGSFDPAQVRDPFNGVADLRARVLRHVTLAFCEDPVRILRVARLSARFSDFSIHPQTQELMCDMVQQGEADHLVPERVWQELSRGLMEQHPSRMLDVLRRCGALARILPELKLPDPSDSAPVSVDTHAAWEHLMRVVDTAALWKLPLAVRFACLTYSLGQRPEPDTTADPTATTNPRLLKTLCERIRVPVECRELAEVVAREHVYLQASDTLEAADVVRLLERCDALRKPERFDWVLQACACVQQPPLPLTQYPQAQRLSYALNVVLDLPTQTVAEAAMAQGASGKEVGELIHAARVKALRQAL